ncbi:MAG: pyrroline-5-carboxylate reductase [Firmicutes bacterium]|nr:pyrroline-5-carboxylate reductase [Alicyclobacillaceae bacterium]MCL6496580.1 pyrroline-5-carboxylate reductase [Bacillota bacterium]
MERIVVMGAGNLAHALVQGWQRVPNPPWSVAVLARSDSYLDKGWRPWPAPISTDPAILSESDLVVLAVKPKDVNAALQTVSQEAGPAVPVLSMVAGLALATLRRHLPHAPLARAMPNICSAVGEGVTAVAFDRMASSERAEIRRLLEALGDVVEVEEALLDPITALSGSGPAYAYVLLEALIEAGERLGLDPVLARRLSVQTLRGAAALAQAEPQLSPADLIRLIASPGGTTEAALDRLADEGVKRAVCEAIFQARLQAQRLGSHPSA